MLNLINEMLVVINITLYKLENHDHKSIICILFTILMNNFLKKLKKKSNEYY